MTNNSPQKLSREEEGRWGLGAGSSILGDLGEGIPMEMLGGGGAAPGEQHPGLGLDNAPEVVQNNPLLMFLWSLSPFNLNLEPDDEAAVGDEDFFFDDDFE